MATPQEVVDRMLQMAEVTKADVVYDLGSGDGRLVITAAKRYGARGVGIDIDPALITQSRANARKEGVESLVEFRQQDALTVDVSPRQRGDALPAQRRQPEAAADAAEAAQAGLADRLAPVRHGRLGARRGPRRSPTSAARHGCSISGSSARHDGVRPRPEARRRHHRDHHAAALPASRLMNDRRFPWVILVPARPAVSEIIDLDAADRARLIEEIALVSTVMRDLFLKGLMAIQSLISLAVLVVVISRVINILPS